MTTPIALDVLRAAGGFAAGALLGFAHFSSLRINARMFAGGGAMRAFGLQGLRFCLLLAVLGGLTMFGALVLLSGTFGLLLTRNAVLRRTRRMEGSL